MDALADDRFAETLESGHRLAHEVLRNYSFYINSDAEQRLELLRLLPRQCERLSLAYHDHFLPFRSETLHLAFAQTDWDMRALDPIVFPLRLVMRAGETKLTDRGRIGLELVGDDCPRRTSLLSQQLAQQPTGCLLVPLRLNEDIEYFTVLVHGTPQIHPPPTDGDKHFIEMPLRMRPRAAAPKAPGDLRPELCDPSTNRLVRNLNAALG